jgi:hypothetical protein
MTIDHSAKFSVGDREIWMTNAHSASKIGSVSRVYHTAGSLQKNDEIMMTK